MSIEIVVAFDEEHGIGRLGSIPWNHGEDVQRFRNLTIGAVVVMGRKTWESIPERNRPLKDRVNCVLSRDLAFTPIELDPTMKVVRSYDEIDEFVEAQRVMHTKVFVIGGAALYDRFLGKADVVHVTRVPGRHGCDVFFPHGRLVELYTLVSRIDGMSGGGSKSCIFETYEKLKHSESY